jgi:putative hydrolase of the HAD superfamily
VSAGNTSTGVSSQDVDGPGAPAEVGDRSPIQAVLFDFGGVILSSPFEAFARFELARGLPDGFLRRVNATNPDTNAWALLERSEVSVAEFGDLFAAESAALGYEVHGLDVLPLLSGTLRPEMVEALRRISARLPTGLLTNNVLLPDGHVDREPAMDEVLALFDAIIESSKVGVRKPDPRFYELACEALAIEPSDAVFLDDLGINLKPARAMGMHTIKVTNPTTALAELEALLHFPLT